MQDQGWTSVIWTQSQFDLTKLGCNLHLYIVWLLLKKKAFDSTDTNECSWVEWNPVVLWKREGYREIVGSIQNLIRFGVLEAVKLDYVAQAGKEDAPTIYRTVVLDDKILADDGFDHFSLNVSYTHPKVTSVRLSILIDSGVGTRFIDSCLAAWKKWETRHFKYDFASSQKQSAELRRLLEEKRSIYDDRPFAFDTSELPNWIDAFAALISLEKEGVIRLSPARKKAEVEYAIPKTFPVSILSSVTTIEDVEEAALAVFSYDNVRNILRFQNKVISLNPTNEAFLSEFFDLCHVLAQGVQIEELTDALDAALSEKDSETMRNLRKRHVYDRVPLLNKKIAAQTGVPRFLMIRDRKVYLSDPHCIVVSD